MSQGIKGVTGEAVERPAIRQNMAIFSQSRTDPEENCQQLGSKEHKKRTTPTMILNPGSPRKKGGAESLVETKILIGLDSVQLLSL